MLNIRFGKWWFPRRHPQGGGAVGTGETESRDLAARLIAEGDRAERQGNLEEACQLYRKAVSMAPDDAAAHLNLGIALATAGDADGARAAYEAALALDPDDAYVHYNLANLLAAGGDWVQAEAALRRSLRSKPDFPEALVVLSNVLDCQGRLEAAADALVEALKCRPDYPGALYNSAVVFNKLGRWEQAEAALRRMLELDTDHLGALELLSTMLRAQGLMDETLDPLRKARALAPERFDLESKELFALGFNEDIGAEELFARHRDFGARLERAIPRGFAQFQGMVEPERRLRIGYVSGDFWVHPVSLFLLPVIERHDRARYEIFCYSTGATADHITERIQVLADHWIEAAALSDDQLATRVQRDGIDVLVDLSGHTGTLRLPVFARRPAPVQATWLGYLNTTGLTRMDYRICDARTDPVGISDRLHTETLVRLPRAQWCYRPFLNIEASGEAPYEANGFITFGSFNQPAKISAAMCRRWAEILRRVPRSRLLLLGVMSERKRRALRCELSRNGLSGERIELVPRVDLDQYFAWFNGVDIALDTFPYGGGTTTFDALWMGVPVVTATGAVPASRSATSILSAMHLDSWIASSIDAYATVAIERAADPAVITELRRTLRPRLQTSPLMDEGLFVRDLEDAYRRMWREHSARAR